MTELQPTEVELTGKKKKPASVSKRKIILFSSILAFIVIAAILTVILARDASHNPDLLQPGDLPTSENSAPEKP